ncbi:DgyrCDS2726 [Dimorphilus gyrociliatus]|uniref:Folliculin n=1 Tax=Dimorphilus gyrociliatus TaxID=2664684 RepID=A0A7I8VDV9_9ANNE|nr:DgyrCDS2726 [Dimorphilus gyrociliatus]
MNAVISLCHFCDNHGPQVIFTTQAFHAQELYVTEGDEAQYRSDFLNHFFEKRGNKHENRCFVESSTNEIKCENNTPSKTVQTCEGCSSLDPLLPGYVSKDNEANVSYISSQHPPKTQVYEMLKQSCMRSLTGDDSLGPTSINFYGDSQSGHTLSYTFHLKDSGARGSKRQYSIIVLMMDKIYLLNSWSFLVKNIKHFIEEVIMKGEKSFQEIQKSGDTSKKRVRAFVEITNDPNIFRKTHQAFLWILQTGGNRLTETILEGPPTEDSILDLEKQEVTEEGFIKLFSEKKLTGEQIEEGSAQNSSEEEEDNGPVEVFKSLRHFLKFIGLPNFHSLAHHILIGKQVVIRAQDRRLVKSAIDCLKILLPQGCCRIIYFSNKYEERSKCNLLGMPISAQLRQTSKTPFLLLNISESTKNMHIPKSIQLKDKEVNIKSSINLSDTPPRILTQIERILLNTSLNELAIEQSVIMLREEWLSKVKVLFKYKISGGVGTDEVHKKLLTVVKATTHDMEVLNFWKTGLSVQYKKRMANCTKPVQF